VKAVVAIEKGHAADVSDFECFAELVGGTATHLTYKFGSRGGGQQAHIAELFSSPRQSSEGTAPGIRRGVTNCSASSRLLGLAGKTTALAIAIKYMSSPGRQFYQIRLRGNERLVVTSWQQFPISRLAIRAREDDALRLERRIVRAQVTQRRCEESGPDEQRHRQRDLCDE